MAAVGTTGTQQKIDKMVSSVLGGGDARKQLLMDSLMPIAHGVVTAGVYRGMAPAGAPRYVAMGAASLASNIAVKLVKDWVAGDVNLSNELGFLQSVEGITSAAVEGAVVPFTYWAAYENAAVDPRKLVVSSIFGGYAASHVPSLILSTLIL